MKADKNFKIKTIFYKDEDNQYEMSSEEEPSNKKDPSINSFLGS